MLNISSTQNYKKSGADDRPGLGLLSLDCFCTPRLLSDVRHQGNDSCLLDSLRDFSLVNGACSCDSSRKDLTSLGNVLLECINIFVIYALRLISAELAYFLSSHAAASLVIKSHDILSFLSGC